jgi:hypothetical protein
VSMPGIENFDNFSGGSLHYLYLPIILHVFSINHLSRTQVVTEWDFHVLFLLHYLALISPSTIQPLGLPNPPPSPLISCGYVSDIRSGNIGDDVVVADSLTTPMGYGGDEDHEGVSDDLSCICECSYSDGDQDSEDFHDCVKDDGTDEENLMRRVNTWIFDATTDSRLNDYHYYYHRSEPRANVDGPPGNYCVHDDVPPNNNYDTHDGGNDRSTYIEVLSPIPISQYENASVAISHRPCAGPCCEAELNLGQY